MQEYNYFQLWPVLAAIASGAAVWGMFRNKVSNNTDSIGELKTMIDDKVDRAKVAQDARDQAQDEVQKETNRRLENLDKETTRRFEKQDDNMSKMSETLARVDANMTNVVGWIKRLDEKDGSK